MFLLACQTQGEGCTAQERCENKGGFWQSYNCHEVTYTDVEYIGGKCGYSVVYCEGAVPIVSHRTGVECDHRCVLEGGQP